VVEYKNPGEPQWDWNNDGNEEKLWNTSDPDFLNANPFEMSPEDAQLFAPTPLKKKLKPALPGPTSPPRTTPRIKSP
jgi:hypothetical protein